MPHEERGRSSRKPNNLSVRYSTQHKVFVFSAGSPVQRQGLSTVYCGGWDVGRIYESRGGPESLCWFWSFTLHGPMTRSDRAATLEAKAQFQKSWEAWKAWAKMEEAP
jgi:hypothetical protein